MRSWLTVSTAIIALLLSAIVWSLPVNGKDPAPAPTPAGTKPAPGRLTFASYNAAWLLDVFRDPYINDGDRKPKPRAEIELLAKAIREVNPDVLAVTEVENEGVLKGVVKEFLADMGYEYVTVAHTNSDRGQNLGIVSRRPIVSMTSHRFQELRLDGHDRTWRFARDLWRVEVQVTAKQNVELYIVHLKSKLDSADDKNSATWRLAEATAARRIINDRLARQPDALIAMLGDFNDTPESPTLATLLTAVPANAAGKPPLDSAGFPGLSDSHASLPAKSRITYIKEPHRSTIDYILTSPALAKRLVPGSPRVLDDQAVLGGSDHAPVSAAFQFDP